MDDNFHASIKNKKHIHASTSCKLQVLTTFWNSAKTNVLQSSHLLGLAPSFALHKVGSSNYIVRTV